MILFLLPAISLPSRERTTASVCREEATGMKSRTVTPHTIGAETGATSAVSRQRRFLFITGRGPFQLLYPRSRSFFSKAKGSVDERSTGSNIPGRWALRISGLGAQGV